MEHAGIAHGTTVGLSVPLIQPSYFYLSTHYSIRPSQDGHTFLLFIHDVTLTITETFNFS